MRLVVFGGTAPPSSVGELRDLLQPGARAPCARQGYAAPSTGADSRAYCISHLARRSTSALRSDGIIGRHTRPHQHFSFRACAVENDGFPLLLSLAGGVRIGA